MFLNLFLLERGSLSNYFFHYNCMENIFCIKYLFSYSFQEPHKKIVKIISSSQSYRDIESDRDMNIRTIVELLSLDIHGDKVTIC